MATQTSILIFGRDVRLLDTRRMVLERAGYWVVQTTELASVAQLVPLEQIDLLILCHSLTAEQCRCAVAVVNQRWPQVQTLILTAGQRRCALATPAETMDASEGPVKLLNAVSRLVHAEPGISLMH